MEEILASIRRIISEDGSPAEDPKKSEEPSAESPSAGESVSRALGASDLAPAAASEPEDDALLLTEMVADDGTVISLSEHQAPAGTAAPTPIEPAPEPPLPEPVAPLAPAGPAAVHGAAREPESEPELEPEVGVVESESEPGAMPESQPGSSPEPALQALPEPEPKMDQPEQPESPAVSPIAEPQPHEEPSRLVSDATFAASTAALSQLSRTARKDKDFSFGGGRMVEDLVREALEPMLKEWLDANLQGIVERLVRQEIERMVRRAEED